MGECIKPLLRGFVGSLKVMGDLIDPLSDAGVARSHHLGQRCRSIDTANDGSRVICSTSCRRRHWKSYGGKQEQVK